MANKSQIPSRDIPPMSPAEFKAALATLGIGQTWAARFFGYEPRMVRRWVDENDEKEVPLAVAMVLRLAIRLNKQVEELA